MTSRKQLAINQRALYDDAVKNKMFWNATPSFQEFQRRLQNPKYVQTVQANYRAHGRSGDAFDTLSGFRDYFCVSDEDKQDMTQGVGNMIADTKARFAGQQRYNKLKQHQDKQRGGYGRLDLGVKNPLTNDNVVREPLTGRYLTSDGAEYAQEYEAARAQNHIDETGKRYTEAVERGDLPSAFEVRDKDGNYALMEDLGVKPGVHVTEKGKQQQLAGLVNTRKSVEEQYNALYRKLEEDFKRSAPFSINTHSQYGIDDNDMRLQAYLNSNAQYRRLKAQLHQLDNAIGVGEEAVKGRAEDKYVKNAKGMLGYAYRDLKSFGASALRGLWNAVSDVSTWDLGLQDLQDNMTLYTTVKKARQKGYKNLNDEERQMLDVAAKTGAYTAENQQYLGRGYKAGNVTGESLPFMVEMALNPASGLGEAAMSKYMRNAIAKYGKEAVRKEAWKYVTKKCGYRVAGDVLGAALMTGTTGSARTLADTYDRLTGDIKSTYDSDGKIVYDGTENEEKGILKAYLKAFGATAIENHSEFVGEYFNPLLKGAGALTMKGWKKVNAKSANAFLDNLKDMGSTSTAKWLGNLFDKTQWHGTIGEYAEEVVGNIENALLVGDSTLDTKEGTGVFNLDQNIDTFLGVSLMGGFFSTLKTGAYVRDKVKGERKILMQQSLDLDNSIRYALGADPRLADKWKEWRVALAQGTDEEKKQALKEISENTNGYIKKAMYDYSANAQKIAGMDKATQGAVEDGTITPEQAQRDADIEQAHEEGLAAEGTARHDIQQEHQLRENSLARMLGISAEQLDRMEDEDIEAMTGQNDALDTAIYDYQTSRERYQGVIDRATDEVEQAGIDAAHQIDLYTDHSTGQIRPCVIKGNNGKEDYQGYIVNGNVATHPDGAIDVSGSDKMILYFDPSTGKIEHGDASTFASLGESADATVARQQAIDEAKQQAAHAQSRDIDGGVGEDGNVSEAMPTFPQSSDQEERNAADFDIGQVVNAETGEVIPVSFEGLAEGENAYLTGGRPDGKTKDRLKVTIVDAEGNVTNRVMKRGNVQVDGRMSAEDFRNAYEEAVSSRMAPEADINEQENNVDEEGVVAGGAAPSADTAATSGEEGAASEPAVRDKNGNPIYDKMPISATIADLYDGALDDAEIDGFVSAQIAEAEKAVEKMEKKKPKIGTDKAKYLADKKAWEEGLQEAQRKVQYWQDVKAEVEKITTPEDARGYEEELNGDAAQAAYRNGSDAAAYGAREVTAEFMQSGDVKITPESYRKETGFGAAEQRAMVGKISKGGKSIDRLAEDLEVFDRENYNGMYFGGDSSVAKDAILDYLSSPDSRKGVKKMQSEAEREYVEAYEAERDRYYQEKYHMSYEEYLVYSSQEMPELLRKYSNFDEQLFLERYADEIEAALQKREEQLKQEENGKEGNVSAGEESGHGRSNQVQSGERTDDTGRGEVGKDSAGEVGPRHEGVVESEAASEEPGNGASGNVRKPKFSRRGRVEGSSDERQGDLAETGDVTDNGVSEWYQNLRLSGELDQNNSPFILSPNGQIDFGQITEAHHLPAAPIRLSMGDMTNGYIHINRRHGKQIQKAGFDSIEAFVDYVVNNFTRIKEGASYENASGGKNNTYLIQLQDGHNNTLFVQLSRDGKYWNVNSAGVFGKKYGDKKEEIWSASEVQNDNSAVASDGLQSEPIADNGSTSNGTPSKQEETPQRISSGGKDTNNTDTKQGNEEKSAGGEKEPMSPTPAMIDRMIEEQRVDDVSELLISSELKKAAEGIAEAFGMKVVYLKKVFIKSDDPAVEDFEGNGFVRNGVIYLSLKEANIAQFTFGHELLHQLKQIDADSYMRIRQKVIDVMGRKAFEMEVKARQMMYANVPGYTLFEDYAEEVIADTLGDIITHTDMLPNIARSLKENPSLLDRFLNVVDNVRQYFRGKTGGALGDLVNDIRDTYEMTARQGAETNQMEAAKDRQFYASLGVSMPLGEEAAEGEPRWASSSLSEQQLEGDDTIRFSLNYDKWDREMASWLKRNRLPKNAQRPVVPQREAGESDLHFAGRLAKYNQDKALWNTAPKYEGHLSSGMTARGEFNYELQRGSVLTRIAVQDSMLAIRKAQEAIARHSGLLKVGTFEDAYMAENNSHGKAKNEFEQYDQEYLEPLRKWFNVMMKRLDGSYNNVTNYMIAKHGLERNAHMAFMAALEAEAKKAIDNTQPDAKRLRAQMVHDAYRQYKADSRRLINDADYEAGKYDYAQWRRTDDAIRKSYCSNYESFRYDKGGVVRDYAGLSSLFLNETDFEEKAAELCADIESKNGHETSELWDAVRQATRQILKNSHDAGMMSDETYNYVRGMYEHYIPLRGWNDSAADEVWDYAGGGRGVFNAALKEAHGRQSLADDPVAYIMNMAESGFLVNNRNWVKQHFLTMAMNHPTDLLTVSKAWYVKTTDQFGNEVWIPASPNIPADETDPAVIEAALDAFQTKMEQMEQSGDATQQRGSLNIEYPQTKSEEREHEVRVMKDGEEYVIYVNGDPQLAQALNNTRAMRVREHEGNFEKACAWLGRKMAAVYTSLSPLFVPSNWARDTTMTLTSTAIREDARYNWLLRTKFIRPDVQMRMFGLVKEYQNGKLREKVKSRTATKMEENFWNFMINGGETGFVTTMDVDAFREKIQRDLKDMGRTRLNPVKVGHVIADSVEYINRVIEDSNRFAIYQTSIEYGRGIEEAVQDAKNVTLNFNRKGTGEMGMSAIRQLYLFINPAIQSLQTLGALAKDHKAKFTAVSSAWMASGMLVPLFNELMFNLASAAAGGGGDDDDEFNPKDEYWKFSSFDRRNNCILWIPFTHNFIKIPLAPEFRGFYGIGDMVASAMWGGENAKESWSDYAADLMGQIIDLSPLDPVSYDGNVLVSLMPNAIRPLVEIAQNVTFTGKPIYRESDFNKYDPSFKKAYAGTPDFLLRYSKWMNSIGNKYPEAQQGPVEQTAVGRYANNPAVIDHLLKSYLGGMYTLGSQIAGAITKASDEETRKDFKTADIPFFSKFVANPNDRPQSKNKGDAYWQDFEKYQRSSHTLGVIRQDARKTGNFSVLEDFYKSEEYKEMKEYEPKAKQRKEEQKYERWKEEGNADLYQPHQQTGEDVYKRHSTPADDFEDTKASILYQKIKPAKDIFDLADVNTPSGMDTFNKYYDLAGKVEEAHSVKKKMNAIVKSFVNDEHKAAFDPEKMKEYRALRKQYVQLVEEGNRMFEKIKAQRN